MVTRRMVAVAVAAVAIHAGSAARAAAGGWEACDGSGPMTGAEPVAGTQLPVLKLAGGAEASRVWLTAEYDGLSIRKFTAKGGSSVMEFTYGDDVVVISLSKERVSIGRNGVAHEFRTAASLEALQGILGGSAAMYHTRLMLSQLERTSELKAGSMSLLSAAAFAAALTGDVNAPARLSERFVQKYRAGFKTVRAAARAADDGGSCWSSYSKEVDAAMTDLGNCISEAEQGALWLMNFRVGCCLGTWTLRAESAWFEYLKCLSPLSIAPKIE